MAAPPSSQGAPIEDRRQLVEYLEAGCKPPEDWRIGTEHEKFVFHLETLDSAPYDGAWGIRALLEGLTRFGWEPV
ncbi:MAG: glutamate--cysteine ligase, partial [Defluviicoccus sp.]|nr:glutamate--cysteine ligase [Defluviicoccus sp.]